MKWEEFVKAVYLKILPLVVSLVIIIGYLSNFLLKDVIPLIAEEGMRRALYLITHLLLLVIIGMYMFAIYQLGLTKDIRDILYERLPTKCSQEEKREEIKTSGGWAIAGMIIGGVLGIPFGPIGIVIGGVLGALVGNQLEYEAVCLRRKKEREKRAS